MAEYSRVDHNFEPVFNENSKILILGSLPSIKSRENNFYYGHPRNRFWKVIAELTNQSEPITIEDKKKLLLENQIAIWDVIKSCDIKASSDSSIKNVIINNINDLLNNSNIQKIFANGNKAKELYDKYAKQLTNREIIGLPSTSPANAGYSLEKLVQKWSELIKK